MRCRCSPSRSAGSTSVIGGNGHLSVDEYESLGRLEGAIREEAQRVIADAEPAPGELEALHAAFVPTMVRINAEGGYARRRALFAWANCT